MTTGERMKLRRKELGLSAEYVAERLGYSASTIYRYEKGDIEKLPVDALKPLAAVLCTTPSYLMGLDEEQNPDSEQHAVSYASSVGERIQTRRQEVGLTLDEFSAVIGVNKTVIKRYEAGTISRINLSVIGSMANALRVNPNWILGRTNSPDILSEKTDFVPDVGRTFAAALAQKQLTNTIRMVGRDGSFIEQELTDEQLAMFKSVLDQMRPVTDKNI